MRPFAVFCLLLAAPACAWAGEFQSVSSIRAAALSTLDPAVEGEATVDANLRLPACPVSLQARATGNRAVEVGCPQPGGWKLFVPVAVRNEQSVLMLARGVAAGETLGPADITTVRRDTARMAGAVLSDPQLAVGRVARRALGAGTVLGAGDLVAPRIIRRGDSVALVSRRGGVEVRVAGKALGDAGQDERVSVENLSSRRVVQGTVIAGGDVLVSR